MVLNIANGTVLKEYLTEKYANDEKIISFNESAAFVLSAHYTPV